VDLGCERVEDLPVRDFPKWAEPEISGLLENRKSGAALHFAKKVPLSMIAIGGVALLGIMLRKKHHTA
jgi:hypothetical protein